MRLSLFMRAGGACAAATLVLLLNFQPSFARMAAPASAPPSVRPATSPGHLRFDARGLGRFGFNRSGASDVGFDRFASSRFNFGRRGFDRSGWDQWTMWNGNAWEWNPWGFAGWGGWGVPAAAAAESAAPIIIDGAGPEVAITVNAGMETGAAGGGYPAGCVIHKLIYDRAGKYVGERQTPEC